MSFYEIEGGRPFGQPVRTGAKNSVLPIPGRRLSGPGPECHPQLSRPVRRNRYPGHPAPAGLPGGAGGTVLVDASALCRSGDPRPADAGDALLCDLSGALLARLGKAELSYPGGCELGPGPSTCTWPPCASGVAEIREEQGQLPAPGRRSLTGQGALPVHPSVGATENAMLAACGCPGSP